VLVILLQLFCHVTAAPKHGSVTSTDGTEISFTRYPAEGKTLFIWLPSEAGIQEAERRAAAALSQAGNEVWLADLFESRFLPVATSSLDRIPAEDVASLITAAYQQKQNVYLLSNGRGSLPLLRGLHHWQLQHPLRQNLPAVILLSPKFYYETPDPGQAAHLLPIVEQTNALLFIIQPTQSPWRWKLEQTIPALQHGGSDVYLQLLPRVRDRFYFRPDATPQEQALGQRLPALLRQATHYLSNWPPHTRTVNPVTRELAPLPTGKKPRELKTYAGDPLPPPLQLNGLDNKNYDLADYRGQVVLVNFWASWCPPCVHEMPSMQRLQKRLQDRPFTILAVNMAEDRQVINKFLNSKVNVSFPILLDRDGQALQRWGVFAFPTSYVIDKQGRIRYALFGSVDWEDHNIVSKLTALLNE
jgi:thiol-disulfide isomerase/thioredoxin